MPVGGRGIAPWAQLLLTCPLETNGYTGAAHMSDVSLCQRPANRAVTSGRRVQTGPGSCSVSVLYLRHHPLVGPSAISPAIPRPTLSKRSERDVCVGQDLHYDCCRIVGARQRSCAMVRETGLSSTGLKIGRSGSLSWFPARGGRAALSYRSALTCAVLTMIWEEGFRSHNM